MKDWTPMGRPGPFGSKRDAQFAEWDLRYGKGRWMIGYKVGEEYLSFKDACEIYGEAYFCFMRDNVGITTMLVKDGRNVWDDKVTNIYSGFDYEKQETVRTHIQDIAIRNALRRLGLWFKGRKLIQIRSMQGDHPLSLLLSPGAVPFHKPELIEPPLEGKKKVWYKAGTVEDWYQRSKYLMVKE